MADPTSDPDDPATTRIDAADDATVHEWAAKFDVSAEQIREAVQAVGDRAGDVEMHLKGTRSTSNSDRTEAADS